MDAGEDGGEKDVGIGGDEVDLGCTRGFFKGFEKGVLGGKGK